MNIFGSKLNHPFINTFREFFTPRKPRHPFMRILIVLVALGILIPMVILAVFIGSAMIAGTSIFKITSNKPIKSTKNSVNIMEGQYRVIDSKALPNSKI